jgi:hypothetical protein
VVSEESLATSAVQTLLTAANKKGRNEGEKPTAKFGGKLSAKLAQGQTSGGMEKTEKETNNRRPKIIFFVFFKPSNVQHQIKRQLNRIDVNLFRFCFNDFRSLTSQTNGFCRSVVSDEENCLPFNGGSIPAGHPTHH